MNPFRFIQDVSEIFDEYEYKRRKRLTKWERFKEDVFDFAIIIFGIAITLLMMSVVIIPWTIGMFTIWTRMFE
jgi:hypothetical protein